MTYIPEGKIRCPYCKSVIQYYASRVEIVCPDCGESFTRMNTGEFCNLGNCKCRHCSAENVVDIKRVGVIATGKTETRTRKIPLGLFCSNVNMWVGSMKACPVPDHIRNPMIRMNNLP